MKGHGLSPGGAGKGRSLEDQHQNEHRIGAVISCLEQTKWNPAQKTVTQTYLVRG